MEVTVIEPHGFCGGVTAALKKALKALEGGARVYCLHTLVHNEQVIADLRQRGMVFVESLSDVPEGSKVLFSAHGVSPAIREEARRRNLDVVDATCPMVARVHLRVQEYSRDSLPVVVLGHRAHAETAGIAGEVGDSSRVAVVTKDRDIDLIPFKPPFGVVSQTTMNGAEVEGLLNSLKSRFGADGVIADGATHICNATDERQLAVARFAKSHVGSGVLVLGSATSSNTLRLAEVAVSAGAKAWRAGSMEELESLDLSGVSELGVTSGASTPEDFLHKVVARLRGEDGRGL